MSRSRLQRASLELALGASLLVAALVLLSAFKTNSFGRAGDDSGSQPAPSHALAVPPDPAAPAEPANALPTSAPVSYQLNARLDADEQTVFGDGRIVFTNVGAKPLRELWFHLYLNAFKNSETLFARSPFSSGRGGGKPDVWGYLEVTQLSDTRTGEDLWAGRDLHSPGDPQDETDIRVPLNQVLSPGETIGLDVQFTSKLPAIVERTGFSRDYYFVAQWFPKLAKFDPEQSRFKHFAFHPQAEFYADFADYDVHLDVPSESVVGSTGQVVSRNEVPPNADQEPPLGNAARKRLHVQARRVHDFAWTAWPGFVEHTDSIGDTQIRVLYPPGHERNLQRTLFTLRFALPHFEQHYGAYPYPNLTLVHPPHHARNSGGMEYPTLITTGGNWHTSLYTRSVELVTIHELAHQWFYGLLASNEPRWPFLDEGFASFAEAKAVRELFGTSSAGKALGLELSAESYRRSSAAQYAHDVPVAQPAADFPSFAHLGSLVYNRTATLLETLENVHGEQFEQLMRAYTQRYRFAHPDPEDFMALAKQHLGNDAAADIRRALFERGWVDFAIGSVQSAERPTRAGMFGSGNELEQVVDASEHDALPRQLGRVLLLRRGNLTFPVDVDLYDDQGNVFRKHWDGSEEFTFIDYEGEHPLAGAVIDPDVKITLDQDLLNNSSFLERRAGWRSWERSSYISQLLIHLLGP